jgi:hypothetical protein
MRSYMTGGQGQGAPGGYAPLAGGDFDDLGKDRYAAASRFYSRV